MKNKGFVLRDLIIIITIPLVLALIIYAVYYNFKEDMKIEDARGIAQAVEVAADYYYKNYILRPDEYAETLFDLSDPSIHLRSFIVGRKPEHGQDYIRPIDEIIAEMSFAVYYNEYCAIKYYKEPKFTIKKMKPEKCVLDVTKLNVDNN